MTDGHLPIVLGVARRGAPEETRAICWALIERDYDGLTEELAHATRCVVLIRALGLPDERIAPAYRRAVAADAPLTAFFSAVDDYQALRRQMRAPTAAVLRWRVIGTGLLDSAY